jgi:transcriptional regulator with XRE-family HTH domain
VGTPEVIRQRRMELGLTQGQLAQQIGVDVRQINRYESGATEPTLAIARRIADRLHITMDELAGAPTPFTGIWWSAWHGLAPNDQLAVGPVELTQSGRRCIIQPAWSDAIVAPAGTLGLSWRAELLVDPDALLGWYKSETPDLPARGTLLLHLRNHAVDGDWTKLKLPLKGSSAGKIALAADADAAQQRLQQVLDITPKDR